MSLHLPVNKPRSIKRQLPTYSSPGTLHAPIPPSLEQSLDEWLSRTGSNNSQSSDVYNDFGNHSQYLSQSSISTSPTTSTISSESPQQQPVYPCLCCQLPKCTAWKTIIKVTHKLETETRLAAEVGQSLLQTNEAYKVELDKLKQQVKQCQEQKHTVELSLDDAESLTRQLEYEKDKWMWKYEKSQKILDESAADLETANIKCAALTRDIEESKAEMDKLQHLKIKSNQFGTRQDILESKLQDMKQELVISRKDKAALEVKCKKLTTQYETLLCAYQELCKEAPNKRLSEGPVKPLSSITPPTASDIEHATTDELVTFVKELVSTNNELKSELLTTSTQLNDLQHELNVPEEKYSQCSNNGRQNSISTTRTNGILLQKHISTIGKNMTPSNRPVRRSTTGDRRSTAQKEATTTTTATTKTVNTKARHRSASVLVSKSKSTRDIRRSSSVNKDTAVSPRTTTSSPVVHHHYHYYTDLRQQNISTKMKSMDIDGPDLMDKTCLPLDYRQVCTIDSDGQPTETTNAHNVCNASTLIPAPPTKNATDTVPQPTHQLANITDMKTANEKLQTDMNSLPSTKTSTLSSSHYNETNNIIHSITNDLSTPTTIAQYTTLMNQARIIIHRIHATDLRTINRRLQRAFDIGELSKMSNSLLQNIISDVDTMYARFSWRTPDENDGYDRSGIDETNKNNEFLLMVQLLQELLHEFGQLSITINHLQVAYVKKVQENDIKAGSHLHTPTTTPSLSSSSSSSSAVTNNNDSTSLSPSRNTLCNSSSSKSSATFINHNGNTVVSSHCISPLYVGNNSTTCSHDRKVTRTGDGNSYMNIRRLKGNAGQRYNLTTHSLRCKYQQQYSSPRHDYNKTKFWSSISSMMDAWNQRPPMENTSFFSDREWI